MAGVTESFLFEAPPEQQHRAVRNYLITASRVITLSWAARLIRAIRSAGRGPAPR